VVGHAPSIIIGLRRERGGAKLSAKNMQVVAEGHVAADYMLSAA